MLLYLLTFLAGVIIEASNVLWVHASERGRVVPVVSLSMLVATAEVLGIGESIHSPGHGVCFVSGFGVGAYIAVRWKERKA
jgi:hypothetical protein